MAGRYFTVNLTLQVKTSINILIATAYRLLLNYADQIGRITLSANVRLLSHLYSRLAVYM